MMQHSKKGYWGRGLYFAVDPGFLLRSIWVASLSLSLSLSLSVSVSLCFFVAHVLYGAGIATVDLPLQLRRHQTVRPDRHFPHPSLFRILK